MNITEIFHVPDNKMWRVIRKKYKEDPNQIEEQIEKFKNWLKSEPCLPTDIDEHLIRNFIRYQESDLEKAKEAFKRYLISISTTKSLMQHRDVTKGHFRDMINRCLTFWKDLTPEGYRIVTLKVPAHIDNVDFEEIVHFVLVWIHLVLSLDCCAGYIAVYFLENISVDVADKINVELLKEVLNMCYNIAPFRVVSLHLVNAPEVPKTIQNTLESFVKPEFIEKVNVRKANLNLKKDEYDDTEVFDLPDDKIWSVIKENNNEDPELVSKQIKEFKNWLNHETHLPKDVDNRFIWNLIRHQQCNLDNAKGIFERYVIARNALKDLLPNLDFDEEYFEDAVEMTLRMSKTLSSEGYRTGVLKLPIDTDELVFKHIVHYFSTLADFILLFDICAGYVAIYDFQNIPLGEIKPESLQLVKEVVKLIYNILPFRILSVHFLNLPEIPETLRSTPERYFEPEYLSKVHIHKDPSTLKDYLPENMIPVEYGGSLDDLNRSGKNMKRFFIENKDWIQRVANLKFEDTFPKEKLDLSSLVDLEKEVNVIPPFID